MNKVVVISGPTGIGKTTLAKKLVKQFNFDLINADASQMRKHMDIGTANINDDDFKDSNHYLFKFLEPTSDFSIKDYQDLARPLIEKSKLPLIVGGSGLYIDAALLDYDLENEARDSSFTTDESNLELYARLKNIDPNLASKTHPNNRKRVLRYLEIAGKKEKKASELYDILYITLDMPRELLYEKINSRFLKMIDEGWLDEVKWIKNHYDISKVKEIGYYDLANYIDGLAEFDIVSEKIKQATRNYAKRQLTWFRGSKNKYHNYYVFSPNDYDAIIKVINDFLNK